MKSRTLRELSDFIDESTGKRGDIQLLAEIYKKYITGTLEDKQGFYAVASTEEIAQQGYVLTPGRYVGIEVIEDDDCVIGREKSRPFLHFCCNSVALLRGTWQRNPLMLTEHPYRFSKRKTAL